MKIKLSKETKIIVGVLLGLLLLLIVLKINQPKDIATKVSLVTPTPTVTATVYPPPNTNLTPTPIPQGEYNFREIMEDEILSAYPLFHYLPITTTNWSISYTDKKQVTVLLRQETPEVRQEVLDWISDHGVDPQTHEIIWKKG